MGDHLHRLAQVLPLALHGDDRGVDGAGGGVGELGEALIDESLVVAEIQIGLAPVVGDEHLPVLEGIHSAGVHVDVRVQLLHGHPKTPLLEQTPQRCGRKPFSQRTRHTASDKDVFGHARQA